MTTDNFHFYLQNRLIQTGQTGGQLYSDTSPFSVPCINITSYLNEEVDRNEPSPLVCIPCWNRVNLKFLAYFSLGIQKAIIFRLVAGCGCILCLTSLLLKETADFEKRLRA